VAQDRDQDATNESETSLDQDLSLENYIMGINNAGTSLNTSSYPVPFPLGLHALPLESLDLACPQVEPMSPFERRVAQHAFIPAPSMGAAQH